jgi:hypothetical protein
VHVAAQIDDLGHGHPGAGVTSSGVQPGTPGVVEDLRAVEDQQVDGAVLGSGDVPEEPRQRVDHRVDTFTDLLLV